MSAVVDYVLSGHRYKLLLPRESCAVAFALSGVRCPGKGEPYSEQAIAFMRRKIMQHDVEVRGSDCCQLLISECMCVNLYDALWMDKCVCKCVSASVCVCVCVSVSVCV